MPRTVYYHKHLMYNAAIFAARGEIVCFCDSDAIYKNTFVASILNQFLTTLISFCISTK